MQTLGSMKTFSLHFPVARCALIGRLAALDCNIVSLFLVFMTLAEGQREDVKPRPGILFQHETCRLTQHVPKVQFCGDSTEKNINRENIWCDVTDSSLNAPRSLCRDIWSLGCVLYELCTLRHPVSCLTHTHTNAVYSHTTFHRSLSHVQQIKQSKQDRVFV